MSAATCYPEQEMARERPRRASRSLRVILALAVAVMLAGALGPAVQSPGQAIRGELESAAATLRSARAAPDAATLRRLRDHFPRHAATVAARRWPQVAVTLHNLPYETCRDAASAARRIEGLVVVELEQYRSADACGATNDMTWRFMP
jgi:hypothetical protein